MNIFSSQQGSYEADVINSISVFGELKRNIQSRNFKGGNISQLFGAVKLDMSFADITLPAVLDITQAFGEVKLYVPMGWRIENRMTHFLSTVKDHRVDAFQNTTNSKVLILQGFSTMAAVEIVTTKFS